MHPLRKLLTDKHEANKLVTFYLRLKDIKSALHDIIKIRFIYLKCSTYNNLINALHFLVIPKIMNIFGRSAFILLLLHNIFCHILYVAISKLALSPRNGILQEIRKPAVRLLPRRPCISQLPGHHLTGPRSVTQETDSARLLKPKECDIYAQAAIPADSNPTGNTDTYLTG